MSSRSPAQIASELANADPVLGGLIELVGPPPARRPIPVADRFERLATAILHQQLAGAAAATITSRTRSALGGELSAEGLLAISVDELRSCGVSGAKAAALRDLAARTHDGSVDLRRMGRLADEVVVEQLILVRGVGRWTAEMFLMGALGRHDVWPVGDLGVRAGWALVRSESLREPRSLLEAADHLRPWRSSAAWYCWQAVDVARSNGGVLPR